MNSQFSVEVVESDHAGTILCLTDLNGARSVTNDAEEVTLFVVSRYGDHPIIYRDSTGQWDQLLHQHGLFISFHPIGEFQQDVAIAKARPVMADRYTGHPGLGKSWAVALMKMHS